MKIAAPAIAQVKKRDNSIVDFDAAKIERAIQRAAIEVLQDRRRADGIARRMAQIVAETLRQCIAEAHTQPGLAQPRPVTASFGVATLRPDETRLSDLIRRADIALYEAKRKGRNRVEVDPA